MIIPIVFSKERIDLPESFYLTEKIDPKRIIEEFPIFTFNKWLNQFAFCLENGTEFRVNCVNTENAEAGEVETNSWIELWGSLNIAQDINFVADWLLTNFKLGDYPCCAEQSSRRCPRCATRHLKCVLH